MFIDTHAHIFGTFYTDIPALVQEIIYAKVEKIINVGTTIDESKEVIRLSHTYPTLLFPTVGIHPDEAKQKDMDSLKVQINELEELLIRNKNIVAIGECGLDYKDCQNDKQIQKKQEYLFQSQLDLAMKYTLPVIIHTRFALEDTYTILQKQRTLKGVVHSIDGDLGIIEKILVLGFYVSFNGIITFKNSEHINMLARNIPITNILLETDSPFLTPVPFRGKQNSPSLIPNIYSYIAQLKAISLLDLQSQMEMNTSELFGLSR